MVKNFFALLCAIAIVTLMFVPVFATESSSSASPGDDVSTVEATPSNEPAAEASPEDDMETVPATPQDDTDAEETTEATTEENHIIASVVVSPVQVLDYTKMYHLATVSLNECASVKWYIFKVDGTLYNCGYKNNHHGNSFEILWNSLDIYGKHPAGKWNSPATERLSIVIVATGINGEDDVFETWFDYTWYDSDFSNLPPVTQPVQPTQPTSTQPTTANTDVPHTGL